MRGSRTRLSAVWRRSASLFVLAAASVAILATSPPLPSVSREGRGHSQLHGARPTAIDIDAHFDASTAPVNRIEISLRGPGAPSAAAVPEIEARLIPGRDEQMATAWQAIPARWSIDEPGCGARRDCAMAYRIEVRRVGEATGVVIFPWAIEVRGWLSSGGYQPPDQSLDVQFVADSNGTALIPPVALGGLAGMLFAAAISLVVRFIGRSSQDAVRAGELASVAALLTAALWSTLAGGPGVGPAAAPPLLIAGLGLAAVSWLRPPGATPRVLPLIALLLATPTVMGLFGRHLVTPPDVFAGSAAIGALLVAALLGLGVPLSWWQEHLERDGALGSTILAATAVCGLAAFGWASALSGSEEVTIVLPFAALLAAWVALAYREWAAGSNALRMSGLVIAAVGLPVGWSLAGIGTLVPAAGTLGVFLLLSGVAGLVIAIKGARLDFPETPLPAPAFDRLARVGSAGGRGWIVLAIGGVLVGLITCWTVLVAVGLTPYPLSYALIPAISAALLAVGLLRWTGGEPRLLRLVGLLLVPISALGQIAAFNHLFAESDQAVRLSLAAIAVGGMLLAALGSVPRPPREGLDWTA